ncbi:hypothetical protein CDAR_491961 [Caerostris darwini]|uniref:Uncharacterized protein n=1 Tax=Caerostris darwini TaxID=1538125 RepID=A0AAV4VKJ3_9ARAC|nr:hypothetical protein CDAR_491961 [Caerostris darwini]
MSFQLIFPNLKFYTYVEYLISSKFLRNSWLTDNLETQFSVPQLTEQVVIVEETRQLRHFCLPRSGYKWMKFRCPQERSSQQKRSSIYYVHQNRCLFYAEDWFSTINGTNVMKQFERPNREIENGLLGLK